MRIKSNRIDHMTYLPGMEDIHSDIPERVIAAMEAYDYDSYTASDVRAALDKKNRGPEDFAALLSPAARPFWRRWLSLPEKRRWSTLEIRLIFSLQSTLQTIALITAYTAVLTAITR